MGSLRRKRLGESLEQEALEQEFQPGCAWFTVRAENALELQRN